MQKVILFSEGDYEGIKVSLERALDLVKMLEMETRSYAAINAKNEIEDALSILEKEETDE